MKLRNKKTGEIFYWQEGDMPFGLGLPHPKTLAELNEEWEDYKPAEPLIKDEKIRKAVRAWAEICSLYSQPVAVAVGNKYLKIFASGECSFGFPICSPAEKKNLRKNIKKCERYTIAELCGEE